MPSEQLVAFDEHGHFEITDVEWLNQIAGGDVIVYVTVVKAPLGGGRNMVCPSVVVPTTLVSHRVMVRCVDWNWPEPTTNVGCHYDHGGENYACYDNVRCGNNIPCG